MAVAPLLARFERLASQIEPQEHRAAWLGFACYFLLLSSYYVLRPLRDSMAASYGADSLQYLYSLTFAGTMLVAPLFGMLASRLRITRLLPLVFWFWIANILLFYRWFHFAPHDRALALTYYTWFSVVNLFMISVFWSLMTDLFTPAQATRLFPVIAAGGSLGAVAGAFLTSRTVTYVGNDGLLLIATAGFILVIAVIHVLMREKARLRAAHEVTPDTTLDHALAGSAVEGFRAIAATPILKNQAAFMLLMTWVNAVVYYLQTKIVASSFSGDIARTQAFADINLIVNIASAVVLLFGLGRYVRRFGITSGLMANPVIMLLGLIGLALSPTLLMIRALQAAQAVTQYAIARPCREMCFTVVDQASRYKAKSVIDTVVYRFGDLSSIWLQTGLRALGAGMNGVLAFSMSASVAWGVVAMMLGRRYEKLRVNPA